MRYEERLEQVLEGAAQVFAERGYHRASIRDVARAAGMSVAGLYYYCKSKEELLFRLAVRSFRVILKQLDSALADAADPEEKLRRLIRIHLDYFLKNMAEMKVVSHEAGLLTGRHMAEVAEVKRQYYLRCREILAEIGPAGGDLRLATLCLFGMINWIYTWYRHGRDVEAGRLADYMTRLFLDGFRRQAAAGHEAGAEPGEAFWSPEDGEWPGLVGEIPEGAGKRRRREGWGRENP